MADEIQKLEPENLPQKITQQTTVSELLQLAQPLLTIYTESQKEIREQELKHEWKSLEILSRQNKYLIIGLFTVVIIVLIISGYLFIQGRDTTATNLIQLVVAIGAAAFGGYGWAKNRINNKDEKN